MSSPTSSEPAAVPSSILLVSEPGMDGVFHYVRNFIDHLLKTGWRVHLAYSSVRGCPTLLELVRQVEAAGGRTLDLRVGNAPRPMDVGALWRLWRLARAVRPEIIHGHSSKAGALVRALPLLGIRARCFYTPHAYFQMNQPMNARKRLFTTVEQIFGRIGTTISVSSSEAEYARRVVGVPPGRLRTVISGVNCERFRPARDPAEKREARTRFGLPHDALLLGTVARYSEQKDPLTLYRAVLQSLERHAALAFAHLGKGELSAAVDKLLAGVPAGVRARIHRIDSSEDPATFYRALDAFALPSRYEGFALSALEAIATGLPLIVTSCPGNDDLRQYPLDSVRWAVSGNAPSLAAQIDDWVNPPSAKNFQSGNHRATALARLNVDKVWETMLSFYREPSAGRAP